MQVNVEGAFPTLVQFDVPDIPLQSDATVASSELIVVIPPLSAKLPVQEALFDLSVPAKVVGVVPLVRSPATEIVLLLAVCVTVTG